MGLNLSTDMGNNLLPLIAVFISCVVPVQAKYGQTASTRPCGKKSPWKCSKKCCEWQTTSVIRRGEIQRNTGRSMSTGRKRQDVRESQGRNVLTKYRTLWQGAIQLTHHMCWRRSLSLLVRLWCPQMMTIPWGFVADIPQGSAWTACPAVACHTWLNVLLRSSCPFSPSLSWTSALWWRPMSVQSCTAVRPFPG